MLNKSDMVGPESTPPDWEFTGKPRSGRASKN